MSVQRRREQPQPPTPPPRALPSAPARLAASCREGAARREARRTTSTAEWENQCRLCSLCSPPPVGSWPSAPSQQPSPRAASLAAAVACGGRAGREEESATAVSRVELSSPLWGGRERESAAWERARATGDAVGGTREEERRACVYISALCGRFVRVASAVGLRWRPPAATSPAPPSTLPANRPSTSMLHPHLPDGHRGAERVWME